MKKGLLEKMQSLRERVAEGNEMERRLEPDAMESHARQATVKELERCEEERD